MKRRELVDLLADHAEALNVGAGDDWLAGAGSFTAVSSLLSLFQLAQAVKRALVPVAPSPLFRADLKRQLVQSPVISEAKRPFPVTIVVGTAVSVIGFTIFLLRRLRTHRGGVVTAV